MPCIRLVTTVAALTLAAAPLAAQEPMQEMTTEMQAPIAPALGAETRRQPLLPLERPLPAGAEAAQPEAEADPIETVGRLFQEAQQRMHTAMTGALLTGDTDRDFAVQMIPHHQAAIAMAEIELANGADPVLRRLAQGIIAAQEREIEALQQWLAAHPAP